MDETETETTETETAAELAVDAGFEVPADISTLSDPDLAQLEGKVNARGGELASKAKKDGLTDDELAEAESLAAVSVEFETEKGSRATAAAEKSARATAALAKFSNAPDEGAEGDDGDEGAEGEGEEGTPDGGAEAASEGNSELAVGEEGTEVAKTARNFRGASPAFLRSKSQVQAPRKAPDSEFMVATPFARDPEGTRYDSPAAVANALHKKRMAFGHIPTGTHEMISIATGVKGWGEGVATVGLDPRENLVSMRNVQEALVASGEFCTPQNQLYNFFRLAQPITDVENSLTTVQATRGGIRYITANCDIAGADCIGSYTYSGLNPDSEDPDFEKPCCRVSCPEIDEVIVEAITQCTIFDNLQYRTFPELVENFMEDVAVQFALRKQRYYLDKIDAASTATTGIGSYGAVRALMYDWMIAAAAYRKRHHMPRGASLDLLAPDWAIDLIKADLFNDGDNGLDYLNVPDSAVIAGLNSRNLNVTWYYDDPTSFMNQNPLTDAQAGSKADLNDFPAEVVSFMYAPGTFVKLDGGTLDLGLVRDSVLNKTNDFSMFMEEWLGFAQLGCESVRIDSAVCASGSRAPYADALRDCPTPVS